MKILKFAIFSRKRTDQPVTLTRNNTVKSTRGWINSLFNFIEKIFNKSTSSAPPSDVMPCHKVTDTKSHDVECHISCAKMKLQPSKVFYNKYRMPIVKRPKDRTDDVLENKQISNKQDFILDPDR